jgi:hypothetical protein
VNNQTEEHNYTFCYPQEKKWDIKTSPCPSWCAQICCRIDAQIHISHLYVLVPPQCVVLSWCSRCLCPNQNPSAGYIYTHMVVLFYILGVNIILHHKSKLTWKNIEYYWTTFSINQYYTQHLKNTEQYWNTSTEQYWILFSITAWCLVVLKLGVQYHSTETELLYWKKFSNVQ